MMKIAVPVTADKLVNGHFGHSEMYAIYNVSESKEITDIKVIEYSNGCGCKSGIIPELVSNGVKIMLAGGIGDGAMQKFNYSGIEVVRGCAGSADDVVRRYIDGTITDSGNSCGHHGDHHEHHHGEGHSCNHN
jgi:predicted Fe-Mo cluster-binding NifX family protein